MMELRPITQRAACEFVAMHHRHSKPPRGCLFALAAVADGETVGVAMVGRPVARMLQDGLTAEVLRVCVLDGAPKGACSFLYSRCDRAAKALGYRRVLTYTLDREGGASLRGAGWRATGKVKHGEWSRRSRPRGSQAIYSEPKTRWEAAA